MQSIADGGSKEMGSNLARKRGPIAIRKQIPSIRGCRKRIPDVVYCRPRDAMMYLSDIVPKRDHGDGVGGTAANMITSPAGEHQTRALFQPFCSLRCPRNEGKHSRWECRQRPS
jgi:hypothetical protein